MKKLEEAVIPIADGLFDDNATTLDRTQQSILAAWAIKTAMVWDYLRDREIPVFYSDEQRSTFRASLLLSLDAPTLPRDTLIWLARNGGVSTGMRGVYTDVHTVWIKPKNVTPIESCITTFGYKYLLMQIITVGVSGGILPMRAGPWDVGTVRIWPLQTAADWPPLLTISPALFMLFVERHKVGREATPADIGSQWFPRS